MKTRMLYFRVEKNQHFFEILEMDKIIYTSDMYDELEECVHIGMHLMNTFHEENPLREVEIPPIVNPRSFKNPRNNKEE